jgi:hypothetical protein
MSSEPRKATDVLLDIESKVDVLLGIVRSQDLVIKVLSNKLNDVMGRLDKQQSGSPQIIVETTQSPHPQTAPMPPGFKQLPAGETERTVPVVAENNLPQSDTPQGFRRNSRPETYAQEQAEMRMPMQMPKMPPPPGRQPGNAPPPGRGPGSEIPTAQPQPQKLANKKGNGAVIPLPGSQETTSAPLDGNTLTFPPFGEQNQIPVSQRCVDKNGKSIFLAGVSITDIDSGQPVWQGRTSGTGKWQIPLNVGSYRVTITKQGSSIRDKVEAVQDVHVDGSKSPLELPMMIIK